PDRAQSQFRWSCPRLLFAADDAEQQLSLFPVPFYPPLALRLGVPNVNVRHRHFVACGQNFDPCGNSKMPTGGPTLPKVRDSDTCSTDGELMMEAASTYRAVHAVSPGRLELTEKTTQAP